MFWRLRCPFHRCDRRCSRVLRGHPQFHRGDGLGTIYLCRLVARRRCGDATYVAQGFALQPSVREKFIDGMLKCKVGPDMFQGDVTQASVWPFVAAGTKGVANTMAAPYCNLSPLADIKNQIPILWIYGDKDLIVSDYCFGDLAVLGKSGMVQGYPGDDVFPNQPMVSQMRYVLEKYRKNGGTYFEVMVEGAGHGVMLDHEARFIEELDKIVEKRRRESLRV